MDDYIKQEIENTVSSFRQLPFLFVGTGISMRYAHAPGWNDLLYDIWKIINPAKEMNDYKKLKQSIEMDVNSRFSDLSQEDKKYYVNPILASFIEKDFLNLYYTSDRFDHTVFTDEQNNEILSNSYNPFKYYVAKQLSNVTPDPALPDYPELQYLAENQNKFAGVITTNYDSLLENIFKDFSVLIGQDNLLVANTLNIFEIFKIHGCSSNPNSIVLTEKDYNDFDRKLKYLSAKLLTIFVEHPIIFIGYGLGDVNIRKLFREIAECLTSEQMDRIRNNFIYISPAFGGKERCGKREIVFGTHSIIITEFVLNDYGVVYRSLSKIQSSMPIKLARKLQDMVCNFVYSAEAQNNIMFGDINSPCIDDEKVAIYFGRADTVTQIGFSYFGIDEILEDILYDNKPYLVNQQLLDKTFKNIRSSAGSTLLPIYKYIRKLGRSLSSIPDNYNIISSYEDINIAPTATDKKNYIKKGEIFNSISEIEAAYPNHIPKQVANIKQAASDISADELGNYLKKYFYTDTYQNYRSLFRKLIALYDYKMYS